MDMAINMGMRVDEDMDVDKILPGEKIGRY